MKKFKRYEPILREIEKKIFLGIKIDENKLSKNYGVSINDINDCIKILLDNKLIKKSDTFYLPNGKYIRETFKNSNLDEEIIWKDFISSQTQDANDNCKKIIRYAFTEILNNAIDHSMSEFIDVTIFVSNLGYIIFIDDKGVGIFKKIEEAFNLDNRKLAVFELYKGKVTTDSKRHSGEGIFFSSRVCDRFDIFSDDLLFMSLNENDYIRDDMKHNKNPGEGSLIIMRFLKDSDKNLKATMDKFTEMDTFGFNKTIVPLKPLELGYDTTLVSRSQAKRLLAGLDKFSKIILDFNGIQRIEQGFTDEIFRVFVNDHPNVDIEVQNANEDILNMIKRIQNNVI